MVDDVSVRVFEKAVAPLADADAVNIGGNVRAADVDRHPFFPFARVHRADDRHDPRIVPLKKRHHVRRGDIAVCVYIQHRPVKGQIFPHDRPHLVV